MGVLFFYLSCIVLPHQCEDRIATPPLHKNLYSGYVYTDRDE